MIYLHDIAYSDLFNFDLSLIEDKACFIGGKRNIETSLKYFNLQVNKGIMRSVIFELHRESNISCDNFLYSYINPKGHEDRFHWNNFYGKDAWYNKSNKTYDLSWVSTNTSLAYYNQHKSYVPDGYTIFIKRIDLNTFDKAGSSVIFEFIDESFDFFSTLNT